MRLTQNMEMEQKENNKHCSQSEGGPSPKRQKLNSSEGQDSLTASEIAPAIVPQTSATENGTFHKASDVIYEKLLRETDVGITEYISQHKGFNAILKQRYSDFVVNEIDISGDIVQLTDISPPKNEERTIQDVTDRLSSEDIKKLQELTEKKDKSTSVYIEVADDKAERTKIHQAIRDGFLGLESTTEERGDKRVIKVVFRNSNSRNSRSSWPRDRGNYCKFVLYKENKDTMDAINLIAKKLRIKPGQFQYSGTKDRRAKTSQHITVFRTPIKRLYELNKDLKNLCLGNFSYVDECLKLGQLLGNRFIIVLRNVSGDDEQVTQALESLKEKGFTNYYGMQRFGTTSIPTYHVGRAILHSNWKEAVELILKPREGEDDEITECRRIWWEKRNAKELLSKVPKRHSLERLLLQGLASQGSNNYCNALVSIPRNTRLMYVHSYQSYVWNTMVSRRIHQFGLTPVVGDLVFDNSDCSARDPDGSRERPHVITAENINNYTIHDVVMPLPGYDIMYPENEAHTWYREMLEKDGLSIDNLRHSNKDYSLPGAYRKVIIKPSNVSWQLYNYNDPTVSLVLSDYETLTGEKEVQSLEDGKLKAIKLCITLPPSCYATMAIREILKTDTSSCYQSRLMEDTTDCKADQ